MAEFYGPTLPLTLKNVMKKYLEWGEGFFENY